MRREGILQMRQIGWRDLIWRSIEAALSAVVLSRCQDQYYSTRKSREWKTEIDEDAGEIQKLDQVKGKAVQYVLDIGEESRAIPSRLKERAPSHRNTTRIRRQDPCSNFSDCDRPNWSTQNYSSHVTTRSYVILDDDDWLFKPKHGVDERRNFAVKRPWENPGKACCSDRYWGNRERRRT